MSMLDWNTMKTIVTDLVNSAIPLFIVPLGISVAVGVIALVAAVFGRVFRGG